MATSSVPHPIIKQLYQEEIESIAELIAERSCSIVKSASIMREELLNKVIDVLENSIRKLIGMKNSALGKKTYKKNASAAFQTKQAKPFKDPEDKFIALSAAKTYAEILVRNKAFRTEAYDKLQRRSEEALSKFLGKDYLKTYQEHVTNNSEDLEALSKIIAFTKEEIETINSFINNAIPLLIQESNLTIEYVAKTILNKLLELSPKNERDSEHEGLEDTRKRVLNLLTLIDNLSFRKQEEIKHLQISCAKIKQEIEQVISRASGHFNALTPKK